jgi:hypothetical protein
MHSVWRPLAKRSASASHAATASSRTDGALVAHSLVRVDGKQHERLSCAAQGHDLPLGAHLPITGSTHHAVTMKRREQLAERTHTLDDGVLVHAACLGKERLDECSGTMLGPLGSMDTHTDVVRRTHTIHRPQSHKCPRPAALPNHPRRTACRWPRCA